MALCARCAKGDKNLQRRFAPCNSPLAIVKVSRLTSNPPYFFFAAPACALVTLVTVASLALAAGYFTAGSSATKSNCKATGAASAAGDACFAGLSGTAAAGVLAVAAAFTGLGCGDCSGGSFVSAFVSGCTAGAPGLAARFAVWEGVTGCSAATGSAAARAIVARAVALNLLA